MDRASPGRVLGTVGKPSARRSARVLFRGVPMDTVKVMNFQSFYELKN